MLIVKSVTAGLERRSGICEGGGGEPNKDSKPCSGIEICLNRIGLLETNCPTDTCERLCKQAFRACQSPDPTLHGSIPQRSTMPRS